jgi:sugar phosphate isomerase/epimerase
VNRRKGRVGILPLLLVVATGILPAAGTAAEGGKGLTDPFFAYSVSVQDKVLQDLGYAPIHTLYVGIDLDKQPAYAPGLKDQIKALRGTNTIFWLTVLGGKPAESDAKAVELIRDLGAVAEEAGVRVALYPHAGFYVAQARDALRLVKQVDRKNVGLSITLCHDLMAGNGKELSQIVDEVAPHLFVVTINGADNKEKGQSMGWDRLIQPLGQGSFDVYGFLKKVKAAGFQGPIGLQCYGLKGDPVVHLTQSIKTWKEYGARMAKE